MVTSCRGTGVVARWSRVDPGMCQLHVGFVTGTRQSCDALSVVCLEAGGKAANTGNPSRAYLRAPPHRGCQPRQLQHQILPPLYPQRVAMPKSCAGVHVINITVGGSLTFVNCLPVTSFPPCKHATTLKQYTR